jgi:hypothetical protein
MTQNKDYVKFDGGTWMTRVLPGQEPILPVYDEDRFDYIMNIMSRRIGKGGIVAVLNARGNNDPNGSDFRYEWLFDEGWKKNNGNISPMGREARAFCTLPQDICVVKGQEVWTPEAGLIFYGGPHGKNVNSKKIPEALIEGCEDGCICGISKILDQEGLLRILQSSKLWNTIDFIVTYRGTRFGLTNPNKLEENFYKEFNSKGNAFGVVAMSKGYNLQDLLEMPTVGTSYTRISPVSCDHVNFLENLRNEIRTTSLEDVHGRPLYSGVLTHGLNMVLDKARGYKHTIMRD